ncbi:hypothetical protein ACVW0Y_004638, partial [Pseudomonas sp. TE3786]
PSDGNIVEVRVFSWAPIQTEVLPTSATKRPAQAGFFVPAIWLLTGRK